MCANRREFGRRGSSGLLLFLFLLLFLSSSSNSPALLSESWSGSGSGLWSSWLCSRWCPFLSVLLSREKVCSGATPVSSLLSSTANTTSKAVESGAKNAGTLKEREAGL